MNAGSRATLGLLASLSIVASAQANPESLFRTVRPDATVVVTEHPTGADLVEITVRRGDHTPRDLTAACERIGALTGVPPRGLNVAKTNPASPDGAPRVTYAKATFATDGLIVPGDPRLRMEPILRGLGFGPTPLKNLALIYGGHAPDSKTVRRFANEAGTLRLEAQRLPGGVEYRTTLAPSLREADVILPGAKGTYQAKPGAPAATPATDWTLPAVLGVGALAAGALVYSLLLRPRAGSPKGRTGR